MYKMLKWTTDDNDRKVVLIDNKRYCHEETILLQKELTELLAPKQIKEDGAFVNGLKELIAMWQETGHNVPLASAAKWYECANQLQEYIEGDYSVIKKDKYS